MNLQPAMTVVRRWRQITCVSLTMAVVLAAGQSPFHASAQVSPETVHQDDGVTYFSPKLVGQIGGTFGRVVLDGRRAFVRQGMRILIFDPTDKSGVRRLGISEPVLGDIQGYVAYGDYLYVYVTVSEPIPGGRDLVGQINVLNIKDPTRPRWEGHFGRYRPSPQSPYYWSTCQLVVSKDALFQHCMWGLAVFDLARPEYPDLVSTIALPGNQINVQHSLAVQDGLAFAVAKSSELWILDVSTPSKTKLVATLPLKWANLPLKSGQYIYVRDGVDLAVFDLTNPAAPREVGRSSASAEPATLLEVRGNYVYASCPGALCIFDVGNPSAPQLASKVIPVSPNGPDVILPIGVITLNSHPVLVYSAGVGTQFSDIADPAAPVYLGSLPAFLVDQVWTDNDRIWMAANGFIQTAVLHQTGPVESLAILPAGPIVTGGPNILDRMAYVINSDGSLAAIELGVPGHFEVVGTLGNFTGDATWPDIEPLAFEDKVFATSASNLVSIADVRDSRDLRLLGKLPQRQGADEAERRYLAAYGHFVLVAEAEHGLSVVDIADPQRPALAKHLDGADGIVSHISAFKISGQHAYLAGWSQAADIDPMFLAIDLTDPSAPRIAGRTPLQGEPKAMDVIGDNAYIWDSPTVTYGNFGRIDLRDPSQPVVRERIFVASVDDVMAMSHIGNKLLLTGSGDSLQIVDVSDLARPTSMLWTMGSETGCVADRAAPWDGNIVVASSNCGLLIVRPPGSDTATVHTLYLPRLSLRQ